MQISQCANAEVSAQVVLMYQLANAEVSAQLVGKDVIMFLSLKVYELPITRSLNQQSPITNHLFLNPVTLKPYNLETKKKSRFFFQ